MGFAMRSMTLVAAALWAAAASAQRPIGPGHEETVANLFAPHAVGQPVADGWVFDGFQIDRVEIRVRLRSTDQEAGLVLRHPGDARGGRERTASFVVEPYGPATAAAAQARLREVLAANDDGSFWEVSQPLRSDHLATVPTRPSPWTSVGLAAFAFVFALFGLARGREGSSGHDALEGAGGKDLEGGAATAARIHRDADLALTPAVGAGQDEAGGAEGPVDP